MRAHGVAYKGPYELHLAHASSSLFFGIFYPLAHIICVNPRNSDAQQFVLILFTRPLHPYSPPHAPQTFRSYHNTNAKPLCTASHLHDHPSTSLAKTRALVRPITNPDKMSAAQDEFNELVRNKDRSTSHPSDSISSRSRSSSRSPPSRSAIRNGNSSSSPSAYTPPKSRTFLPSQKSYSNTGPKGVIADAQSFEHARKQRTSLSQNRPNVGATQPYSENLGVNDGPPQLASLRLDEEDDSDLDDENGFMAEWRQERLRQLGNAGRGVTVGAEKSGAGIYGGMASVDGEGYLEAVDGSGRDTVVVVFIYDDRVSVICASLETCADVLRDSLRSAPWWRNVSGNLHASIGIPAS